MVFTSTHYFELSLAFPHLVLKDSENTLEGILN